MASEAAKTIIAGWTDGLTDDITLENIRIVMEELDTPPQTTGITAEDMEAAVSAATAATENIWREKYRNQFFAPVGTPTEETAQNDREVTTADDGIDGLFEPVKKEGN